MARTAPGNQAPRRKTEKGHCKLNIFTATMPVWACIFLVGLPLGLLAFIGFAGWWKSDTKDHSAYWNMEKERDEARAQRDKLNTENAKLAGYLDTADKRVVESEKANKHLHAQNADLREALDEATKEIKALQMNTIEVQEAAKPLAYADAKPAIEKAAQTSPSKRPQRGKKAETQQ